MKAIQRNLLYLYFFSINFELWDPFNTGIDFLITKVTVMLYLLSTLTHIKFFYSVKNIKKYIYPVSLLFVMLTIMNFINRNSNYTTFFDLPFFLNLVILLVATNHAKRDAQILLKGLYIFSISSILLTIMFLVGYDIDYNLGSRVTIFGNNQNDLGLRLSISLLVLVVIIKENPLNLRIYRKLYYIAFPVLFIFMIKTGSRVAFISFFLGLVIFYFSKGSFSFNKIFNIFSFTIITILIWEFFLSNTLIAERLISSSKDGLSGRDFRWIAAIDIFLTNPFFGIGKTGYSKMIETILDFYTSPHNVFIEVLCYTGVLGLGLFVIFITRVFKVAVKSYLKKDQLLSLILLVPVLGTILSGQIFGAKIMWIIFAYIISQNSVKFRYINSNKINENIILY